MSKKAIVAASLLIAFVAGVRLCAQVAEGILHGTVTHPNGTPAKHLRLKASLVDAPSGLALPQTQSGDNGEYAFHISSWGQYTVYADDPEEGYSFFSNGPSGRNNFPRATVSSQQPDAELNLRLPPKAGSLRIHLTNRLSGRALLG